MNGNMRLLAISVFLLSFCCGCSDGSNAPGPISSSPTGPLRSVELALNWFPEAEHGGFYAALVHGYYEQEGLQVNIVPGGPGAPVVQRVASRQVDFAVGNADQILLGRAQDADVVAVATAMQDSPRCIIVHQKSGITNFDDLKNITLAIGSGKAFALYLQQQVPLENVQIVPYSGSAAQFLLNDDYAQQGYVFSEPFVISQQGGDPHNLMVSELGFNPYTSLLFTNGQTIRRDPQLVEKMVRATIRGWQKYLDDPQPTNRYIHRQNPEMSLEALDYGARAIAPLCLSEGAPPAELGRMTADRWQALLDQLVEIELIQPSRVDASAAFTSRFIASPPSDTD